jgi:tRNA pseudouridine55 synthase
MTASNPQSEIHNPQSTDGLLLIDKPAAITSHDLVAHLRRLTAIKRIGHTGTLDPFATGLMLLLFGRATRLSQFFMGLDKEYRVWLRLGEESDTLDATGRILETKPVDVSAEHLRQILNSFRGEIQQIPPMYSAVKVQGKKLYQLARQGKTVERAPRLVSIHQLQVLELKLPELEVLVCCSAGTYVRSLVHDIGQKLGCGAIVTALCRTGSGPYRLEQAAPLAELELKADWKSSLVPMERLLTDIPFQLVDERDLERVRHGKDLPRTSQLIGGWVRLLGPDEKLIALGKVGEVSIHPSIVLA